MKSQNQINIALAGNPNAGKTTLFNRLTGARAHVGNYPGVTVEQKYGTFKHQDFDITVVDLPGSYSLTPYSLEEKVARDFLINERPKLVVDVVDATNLERNLYLTLQFLELGIPVVLALNMMDEAREKKIEIDIKKLSNVLNIPVVAIVAKTGEGLDNLLEAVIETAKKNKPWETLKLNYGELGQRLTEIKEKLEPFNTELPNVPLDWLAVKFLENDSQIVEAINLGLPENVLKKLTEKKNTSAKHLQISLNETLENFMTDQRYGYLRSLDKTIISRPLEVKQSTTEKIDFVLLNRVFSPIILIAVLYTVYLFTFKIGEPLSELLALFTGYIGVLAEKFLSEGLLLSLIQNGIVHGAGEVLNFAPLIAIMFLCISFLEDSGYMARMAFILDRVLRSFGLHGGSVLALIVGGGISGGCAIPGIMATRTLKDPKERLATILATPFMNCGAKVPVFVMLIAAFFPDSNKALGLLLLTALGWILALLSARIIRWVIIPGEPEPFIMELPPYRLPTLRGLLIHSWERTWLYIKKAGTVILAVAVIIWAAMTFPGLPQNETEKFNIRAEIIESQIQETSKENVLKDLESQLLALQGEYNNQALRQSFAGQLGIALEPLSAPLGFTWRTNIALIGGFAAKEVVLSTLGTSYAMADIQEADEDVQIQTVGNKLKQDSDWSPLVAISLMVFLLVYAPCFASVVVIRKEAGTKWALFSIVWNTAIAYGLSFIIYQVGSKILNY